VWKQHPLRILLERSGLNQHEIAKRAGMSQAKLSLAENHMVTLTHEEAEKIRNAIVEVTRGRCAAVARSADPRGFSELAAVAVLGRTYPAH